MFCNNCGQEIDDNAVVCPHCGVATDKMAEVTGEAPNATGAKKTNICAILGFVFAILYWVLAYIPVVGSFMSWAVFIAAFVLSIIGIQNAKKKGQNLKGLAIAGLVLCIIDLVFIIIAIVGIIAALIAAGTTL